MNIEEAPDNSTPDESGSIDESSMRSTFRALVENAFDVIAIIDKEGRTTYVSPSIRYVLGYEADERIGKSAFDLIHPDDAEEATHAIKQLMSNEGARIYLQVVLRHKDGSWRTVELIAHNLFHHPVIKGIVANYRDITERMKTQEALRVSEERYRKAFSASPDMITISYIDSGRLLDVNEGFERLSGYSRTEMVGRSVTEIGLWKDPKARTAMIEQLKREGSVRDFEADFVAKSGEELACLVSAGTIHLAGEPCMLAVTRDVTAQKVAAVELRNASETLRLEHHELAEKNVALKQILGHLEEEKASYRHDMTANVHDIFSPIIARLKKGDGTISAADITLLEAGLDRIIGQDVQKFEQNRARLTPRELDVCELIQKGLSSKEIADELTLSPQTVHKHRRTIRKKLQLDNKGVNLAAFLRAR